VIRWALPFSFCFVLFVFFGGIDWLAHFYLVAIHLHFFYQIIYFSDFPAKEINSNKTPKISVMTSKN